MMHAYTLKPKTVFSPATVPADCPVRKGGPSAVQARDEFQKRIGSV